MSKQVAAEVTIPESLNMDGLELRGNYRFMGYRQDVLHALERKHVAAFIVTSLLRWTKSKRDDLIRTIKRRAENKLPSLTEAELEIWVHMSFEDFADEVDGLFSHNTIKDAVNYLLSKGVIQQRKNPNPKFRDYEYRLMLPVLRELLQSLPVNPLARPRDNRNRKGKQSPNLATPPEMVTSPNQANESPNLVDEPPELVDESPNLAEHYTESTQIRTELSQERKNDEPSQSAHIPEQQDSFSLSFPHSSSDEEVAFTDEEERIRGYANQTICKANPLKKSSLNKRHCSKLAEHIKTIEQFKDLTSYSRQEQGLENKKLHLGNLVRGLDGWLQLQNASQVPTSNSRNSQPVYTVDKDKNERRKAALRASMTQKEGVLS